MGFVPFGMEYASLDDKQKLQRMLAFLGIRDAKQQVEFLSALLGKPFDTQKLSKQEAIDLKRKIKQIQTEKDKA